MSKRTILFLIFPFFFSCTENLEKELIIDINEKHEFNFSHIFDSFNILPLETSKEILIGDIDKILFTDDLIFLLDKRITKTVFAFGKDGKFKFKISSEGFGPGELYSPTNITLNYDKEELIVVDGRQGKFMFYGFDGKFIKEIKKVELSSPYDINYVDGKIYIVDGFTENWHERLKVTDVNLNIIDNIEVFLPEDYKLINGKKSTYLYEMSGRNGLFYKEAINNRFIELKTGESQKDYIFSFSGEQFEAISGKTYEALDFYQEFRRADKYAMGDHMVNSENFSLLSINKGEEMNIALWDRLNDKVFLISHFTNDMDGILPAITGIPPSNVNADIFVWAIHPKDLATMSLNNKDQAIKYENFVEERGIKSDDNPILFIYQMKKTIFN